MQLYFEFPPGWWPILAIIYGLYFLLFFRRKSYKKPKEMKKQPLMGIIVLFLGIIVEYIAVSLSIWTYFPGNWPITLFIAYFGIGMLAYQLVKWVEGI